MEIMKRCIPQNNIFPQRDHTIENDTYSFSLPYLNFYVFSVLPIGIAMHDIINISRQLKNFFLELMTRLLPCNVTHRTFLDNNNKSDESIFLFDEFIFLFLATRVFFVEKNMAIDLLIFCLFLSHEA